MAKRQGHYCKVCGEYKANEKFSGKGHANHICKQCAQLSPAEQSERMTVNKLERMMGHSLNKEEIKYLRNRLNDPRPAVKEAARATHHMLFPGYERSQMQKGLTVTSLDFFICGNLWDEWGDEIAVHERFTMDNSGIIRRVLYEDGSEREVSIDKADARKFLKSIIHDDGALFWTEDLSDDDSQVDELIDLLPAYRELDDEEEDVDDDEKNEGAPVAAQDGRAPIWSLHLELSNGKECRHVFFNQMHQEPQMLYEELKAFFDEDDFDSDAEETWS